MLLSLKGINKNFNITGSSVAVLDELDFSIDRGEIVSITGRSGCGKTTLLNVITGITKPDSGDISYEDNIVNYHSDRQMSRLRNRKMGQIFQTFRLLDEETVLSNLLLPARIGGSAKKADRDFAMEILTRTGLSGYEKTKAGLLSGGQKQRVAIARAAANSPSLILADEPTANLDTETSKDIFKLIEWLRDSGMAIIMVTHKNLMHKKSDRIYVMENGRIKIK